MPPCPAAPRSTREIPATCPDQRGMARPQNGGAAAAVRDIEVRGGAPRVLAAVLPALQLAVPVLMIVANAVAGVPT
jgi:hypothetical protein